MNGNIIVSNKNTETQHFTFFSLKNVDMQRFHGLQKCTIPTYLPGDQAEEKSGNHYKPHMNHPLVTMNVCTTFDGNPFSSG